MFQQTSVHLSYTQDCIRAVHSSLRCTELPAGFMIRARLVHIKMCVSQSLLCLYPILCEPSGATIPLTHRSHSQGRSASVFSSLFETLKIRAWKNKVNDSWKSGCIIIYPSANIPSKTHITLKMKLGQPNSAVDILFCIADSISYLSTQSYNIIILPGIYFHISLYSTRFLDTTQKILCILT
jgi:hypothetical protein